MSENQRRTESLPPLQEAIQGLANEMGALPSDRLNWLMQQDGVSFGGTLQEINSSTRSLNPQEHTFDGKYVVAGTIGGSFPPEQEDKVILLDTLITAAQQHIERQRQDNVDPQTILNEIAVSIPTVVNKLHLFADGNGRTSRLLRMVLRDADLVTPTKTEAAVRSDGFDRYDATPVGPIETSIRHRMRQVNQTTEITILDDLVDPFALADEHSDEILSAYPDIDRSLIRAYHDSPNFNEAVRLLAKVEGERSISLDELFGRIAHNPQDLEAFTNAYRDVRRQEVELLIQGLMGGSPIPLIISDRISATNTHINNPRKRQGLAPIDPKNLNTIQDFQMAYCETFSPDRLRVD